VFGELGDAIAIGAILVLNAVVGFVQCRAERATDALARPPARSSCATIGRRDRRADRRR
jgi:hypothetical protein